MHVIQFINRTAEHPFTEFHVALDLTQKYYLFYLFLIDGLIFVWLCSNRSSVYRS